MREIADVGVGGLRVRSVARIAGVHHATLLYHFPSRTDLLVAVVDALAADFRTQRLPPPPAADAWAQLRHAFADLGARLASDLSPTAVLLELTLAARRDRVVRARLDRLYAGWRYHLAGIVRRGVAEGAFCPDADVALTADAIVAQVQGIGLAALAGAQPDRVHALVERALRATEQLLQPGQRGGMPTLSPAQD